MVDFTVDCSDLQFTSPITIGASLTVDVEANGHSVFLDGGTSAQLFVVNGGNLTLGHFTLEDATAKGAAGTAGVSGTPGTNGTSGSPGSNGTPGMAGGAGGAGANSSRSSQPNGRAGHAGATAQGGAAPAGTVK